MIAAGIDLGGTKVLGRVLDPTDPSRSLATVRMDTPRGGDAIVATLGMAVDALGSQLGARGLALDAVGIGAAGLVDLDGVLRTAPNLPGVADLDLAARLRADVGLPVTVDNDATCAMAAELACGAAVGHEHAVLVTLGTGIGAGLVVDGRVVRGAAGFAGEPGHMVVDPSGPPCPCGRVGCWERFASGSGLGRLARDAAEAGQAELVVRLAGGDPEAVRGEHVTTAARDGDPDALEVLRRFAWWVALGVANLVAVLDTEVVVIGGGLVSAGDLLIVPLREAFRSLLLAADHRPPVHVEAAVLGADAGAIGAGLLAVERLGDPRP